MSEIEAKQIVKVKYFITDDKLSTSEYSYYTDIPLNVGDIVTVPVRDTTARAQVSVVNVPESEVAAFKDKLKTISAPEPAPGATQAEFEEQAEIAEKLSEIPEAKSEYIEDSLILIKPDADQQLMTFYTEALDLKRCAEARVILTNDDLKPANDDLAIIARVKKAMEEKRKEYLKPFQDHVKETNEAYKSFMEPIDQADKITRDKVLCFRAEQEKKRREAEAIEAEKLALARREAELKGGEITIDLTPVAKPDIVPDRTHTGMGSSGQRDNWQWEIVDINAVPREYLMINAGMLTPIVKASKGKLTIAGIRIYNKPIIAVNTR